MVERGPEIDRIGGVSRRDLTIFVVATGVLTLFGLFLAILEPFVSPPLEHRVHVAQVWIWALDSFLVLFGGVLLLASRRAAEVQALRSQVLRASEEEFRALVSSVPVLTRVIRPGGTCNFLNTPWLTFTGKSMSAAMGQGWLGSLHDDDRERVQRTLTDHLQSRTPLSMEYRLRRHDGVYRWMLDRGTPRFDPSGAFLGIISSCIDVTEQHDKDARVRELNEALENAVEGISTLDVNLRFVSMNSAYASVLGASPDELIDQPLAQTIHPADRHELDALLLRLHDHGKAEGQLRGVRMDGTIFFQRITLVARNSLHNEPLGSHAFMKDITSELRSRDVIAAHERELIDYFQNAVIGVRVLDTLGTIIDANRAELNLLGYSRDEYVGRRIQDFYLDSPKIDDALARLARGESVADYEGVLRCRDGSLKNVVVSWSGQFESGQMTGVRCFTQDITERRTAESLASEHLMRFESLANIAPVGIYHTDPSGSCVYVNDRWCKLVGLSPRSAMGDGWTTALHPEDRSRVFELWNRSVASGAEFRSEYRFLRPDTSISHVLGAACPVRDASGSITGYVGTITDITETKQSRDDLLKSFQTQLDLLHRERSLRQELDHRVRNNLASLMGLVSVYERTDRSTQELAHTIQGKISAMVQVHETISRAHGREVDIGVLLGTLRQSFIPDDSPTKLMLEGPPAMLSAAEASALAMIVQELVTNSMKYGAIASGGGVISLSWKLLQQLTKNAPILTLDLNWHEKGRPSYATIEPMGSGVGLSLIEGFARTDLRGSASFERGVGDWRCHIVAELSSPTSYARPIV